MLSIFSRSGRHESTNAFTYASDIEETLIKKYKDKMPPILALITDCGSTTSPRSLMTLIAFGRLFQRLDLDHLICTSHAGGNSKYNKVERAWGYVSKEILA